METREAALALGALSALSRLEIVQILAKDAPFDGFQAGEIAKRTGSSPSSTSNQLKELLSAGLLVQRRVGRSIYYRINLETISSLVRFMLDECAAGKLGSRAPG